MMIKKLFYHRQEKQRVGAEIISALEQKSNDDFIPKKYDFDNNGSGVTLNNIFAKIRESQNVHIPQRE